jgi:hypothetical protein
LKGYYILEELDSTIFRRIYTGNRFKQFIKRDGFWYSPKDEVNNKYIPVNEYFKTDIELEKEAVIEYYKQNSTQEIEKATGIIIYIPELPESEKAKYVSFIEDWEEASDNESSP